MPRSKKLLDQYGAPGFAVMLKSNMMMDAEDPAKFAKELGVRYPLVSASAELIDKFGELKGLPTTLLSDRDGILRGKVIGFEYTSHFEEELKPLL